MFSEVRRRAKKAGKPPGTAIYTGRKRSKPTHYTAVLYNEKESDEAIGMQLQDIVPIFNKIKGITWINVEGLQDVEGIKELAHLFNLHPLTIEDVLNVTQRPKVEEFEKYIFVTLKVLHWHHKSKSFGTEQFSLVFGNDFLISFQEADTTRFDTLRSRLHSIAKQHLREHGTDYLAYRLIDAVVDEYFVVLEAIGDQIETIEDRIIAAPSPQNARTIYRLKRQMLLLRKAIWPMREAIGHLLHIENLITNFTRVYLRDVYDHSIQAIDTLETFRDMLSSMLDMYLSSLTNRMNEIMKTLTIITTIFIPITAIASIYGMNFPDLPGLHWHWGYTIVLASMFLSALIMIFYFFKKKWI